MKTHDQDLRALRDCSDSLEVDSSESTPDTPPRGSSDGPVPPVLAAPEAEARPGSPAGDEQSLQD